jgi:hypothetical protein
MNSQGDKSLNNTNEINNANEINEDTQPTLRPEIVWGFIVFHHRSIISAILVLGIGLFLWNSMASDDADQSSDTTASIEVLPTEKKPTETLLESVIQTTSSWRTQSPPIAAVTLKQRLKEIETLLSRKLPAAQREYCQTAKIETVGFLFSTNLQGTLNLRGTEQAIQEIDRQYSNHESPLLAAKANLTCLITTLDKYVAGKIDVDQLNTEIETRRTSVCESPVTRPSFAAWLGSLSRLTTDADDVRKICLRNLEYIGKIDQTMAKQLAIDLLLNERDLSSLAFRVKQKAAGVDDEVAQLFDSLEKYANFPVPVYSVAASTVRSYQLNGEDERAKVLLERLKGVEPKITFEYVRSELQRGIAILEASAKE